MNVSRIPAVFMRGGIVKGLFFHYRDLPRASADRDRLLRRVVGEPDPRTGNADGLGGVSGDACRIVLVTPSLRDDCDVEFDAGIVRTGQAWIDYGDDCVDVAAAVGPFAISERLLPAIDGMHRVRVWQRGVGRRIDVLVPVHGSSVVEEGSFREDGVVFPSAEIRLEVFEPEPRPGARRVALLPSGHVQDGLDVPGLGELRVTMLVADVPMVIVRAEALALTGRETPDSLAKDRTLNTRVEAIRTRAATAMGLGRDLFGGPRAGPAWPRLAWVAPPCNYRAATGVEIGAHEIDLMVRTFPTEGPHAMPGSAESIALAAAAALPGSVANEVARTLPGVPTRLGHAAGTIAVGAELVRHAQGWRMEKALMSRGARRLMSGIVHLPVVRT
ncbi:MAG: 2-methylaconitate cis-trans isomerase PrpF [Burkholderiaceae bacterium]|nr:2-methylaconitate cis-trans isomerase PrpF [Burkholderiaceae bacterium]